ncbi:unnamed protein product [Allacma fusca]|uniref:FAD-binding PCMH-type domain-containing protein n=1 Tax=Allacma fusca TaxID=39272 RepID=A0A8J2LFA7_9HEXA|nr:unnamed protein product [Allacma fusca]
MAFRTDQIFPYSLILTIFVATCSLELIPRNEGTEASACQAPENFPRDLELYKGEFHNWAEDLIVKGLWNAVPRTPTEVLKLVNWAYQHNYTIRPSGYMHTWAPTTVVKNTTECQHERVIVMKTNESLTQMKMTRNYPFPTVWAQSGANMGNIMSFLEENGYGFNASPAPGPITLGGVVAIAGHGTGIPAVGEIPTPGKSFGSISNLVVDFTAVVWDPKEEAYVLKTFQRSDPEAKAFLTSMGRVFILDMTLRVMSNYNLRCESRIDIPATELFADPKTVKPETRTISKIIDSSGRMETILFPFTARPWLKIWTVSPIRPFFSRATRQPYNYPFSDNIPQPVAAMASNISNGAWELTPAFGELEYDMVVSGLATSFSSDLWGPSKNLLLYIQATTLRLTENGAAILTSRKNIQRVIHESFAFFTKLVQEYQAKSKFPINGPLEIRVSGIDNPGDVGIPGAEAPAISPLYPVNANIFFSEYDVCIWFNILTFPSTPHAIEFLQRMETFFYETYNGDYALIRPEWSKGWAYKNNTSWSNDEMLQETIPKSLPHWNYSVATYDKYDPHRVFSNEFLDILFSA